MSSPTPSSHIIELGHCLDVALTPQVSSAPVKTLLLHLPSYTLEGLSAKVGIRSHT